MRRINLLGYPSPRVLGLHGRISTLGHLSGGDDYGDGNTRRPTRQVASGCGPRPLLLVSGTRRGLATASSSGGSAGPNKQQQQQRQGESAAPPAAAAAALKTESITWEDEGPSLRPEDYAFDDEDDGEEMWERLAGAADDDGSGSHARVRGYSRTKERLAKKFPIEMAELDPDEDEEDEESVPGLGLGGGRRPSQAQQQQQGQELEEEQDEFTPRERRQRDKEEEKDKKWAQIIAPLKFDLEAQLAAGKHIPLWYPHIEEYEGDGYDDYARTLQGTWEDDSPFHRDYEYDEKEFKNHFTWSTDGNQHILNVGRHTKTTKAGRVFSFSATMIDGNGNGRAGWGYGKGPTLSDAVVAAQKDCERNSFFIDRYKGSCLSESIRFSYKKCSVEVFALPEGRLHPTSSQVMQLVFNAFGLQYVAGKWLGSKNKTKRIKTLFMALRQIEHPDYTSEKLGMKLFKPRKIPRKHGRVWSYD